MLRILQNEEYGYLPAPPEKLKFSSEKAKVSNFCAGKAKLYNLTAHCTVKGKEFKFPFYYTEPTADGKHPFFIHINFRDCVPDRYMPTEELVDNGFAVLSFCYKDVTSDDGDFTDGLAGVLYQGRERTNTEGGKIALWAWAAQRVMDYAVTQKEKLDLERSVVCGHSRLGKTALLTAATDERFKFCYSNDSGCCGSAISRGKNGETLKKIYEVFPFWFCKNLEKYKENEDALPFDQHSLIACIAPRRVLIGSASEDLWADPQAEQLSCFAASSAFLKGFDCPDRAAEPGEAFLKGDIAYHLRRGLHYFSREDWARLIEFVNLHS
ncbi:MAG: hypothetical protein E7646_09030 [Ruminococcaceae bacterium]|nr:hypothetical protein [Oscillospiraceae bacterium]